MFSTNAVFQKSNFDIVSGEPKVYEVTGGSGNPAYAHFCGNCSSTMWTLSPLGPNMVVVKVGVLDGDGLEKLAPKAEVFTSRKPGWVKCVDGAIQFDYAFPVFDEMIKGATAAMEVRICLQYLIWLILKARQNSQAK